MINKIVKYGIVGIGGMGSNHAKTILSNTVTNASLEGVCDLNMKYKENFPQVLFYNNIHEFFNNKNIEAVIIATPHDSHVPLAIQSLKNGKHTIVEKPLAVTANNCKKLIEVANNCNTSFGVMLNQRTIPIYKKLKKIIDDNQLGKIHRIHWTITDWLRTNYYYKISDWRAKWSGEGGGVLINQSIHQLDLWQWLFGLPESVYTRLKLGRFHEIEVEDDVTSFFKYKNGAHGIFVTTTGESPGINRLEIAGENGLIVVENNKIIFNKNETPSSEYIKNSKTLFEFPANSVEKYEYVDEILGGHENIIQNFTNHILGKEKLFVDGREGIHSVELINAMIYSGLNNVEVELPINGKKYENKINEMISNSL